MKVKINTCAGGNHVRVMDTSNVVLGVITGAITNVSDEVDSSLNEALTTQVSNYINLYLLGNPTASWAELKLAVEAEEF